ncbi:hypothetical protein DDQ45_24065 [Salmonella enterica]|nr:hypothetical protein [Salmonella enterica]EDR7525153.1 hypothetical protein [Salmonella enterica subsp. enterica serovar Oranienburg]EIM5532969.1 hypothetical protein [Salmonella enterica subsp. enterica]
MLGGADNPNGELPSYITGADISALPDTGLRGRTEIKQLCTSLPDPDYQPKNRCSVVCPFFLHIVLK